MVQPEVAPNDASVVPGHSTFEYNTYYGDMSCILGATPGAPQ